MEHSHIPSPFPGSLPIVAYAPQEEYGVTIACNGKEETLQDCHTVYGECEHDIGVICVISTPPCSTTTEGSTPPTTILQSQTLATMMTNEEPSNITLRTRRVGGLTAGRGFEDNLPAILGAFTGILLLLLVLVLIGWTGTCVVMVRNKRSKEKR